VTALDPRLLLQGYAMGIFPMADSRDADDVFWVEPRSRAILPLDRFHVSRSLRRTLRSDKFTVTADRAFAEVIAACAEREETWINADI
jgi:leucyl/phenylalanyl-tRNA--protein transferase